MLEKKTKKLGLKKEKLGLKSVTLALRSKSMQRAIRGVPLGVVNFTPHFSVIQIFQILFLPLSFYKHPNISGIFVADEIKLFNLTFHHITNF